ncbi:MAG: class sortase [Solirubrobacterales bacterium]|nr:class sortase [Solirubrobacterales bacterium]
MDRRRHPIRRRLGLLLAVIGALVALDGALSIFWQEPLTAVLATRAQHGLRDEWARTQGASAAQIDRGPDRAPAPPGSPGRPRTVPVVLPAIGHAAAKLTIPRIALERIVVRGTASSDLRRGPGLYADLAWPGRGRVSAIAGHRTTWGAPFRHIDALRPGDRIVLQVPGRVLRYRVTGTRIVDPGDRSVLDPGRRTVLVLTACDPPASSRHRIAVRAVLSTR